MQINHILVALVGMIATGAIANPVPEANANAEPEAVEARAEQAEQFWRRPWRGGRRFRDNDFLDVLKRDPEALEARAEQNKQWFGNPCGRWGCGGGHPFDDDFDDFEFEDNDFLDVLKRDESGLQARAEQAEQAKQGEQTFYPGGGRRWNPYRPNNWDPRFNPNFDPRFNRGFRPNRFPFNPNRGRFNRYRPNQWNPDWQW